MSSTITVSSTAQQEPGRALHQIGISFDEDVSRRNPHEPASKAGNRYLVIAAAAMVLFVGVGIGNSFGVFQEYYATNILKDEPPEKVIVIGSTASSLYLVLGAPAGRFADLVGYRPSLILGSLLMVGALFAASVSEDFVHLLLSQGIMFGLGLGLVYLPATSISRQYFKQSHGTANGIVVSGGALGGTIWPYVVRRLLSQQGPAATFRVLGYCAAAALIPSILLVRPVLPTVPIWRQTRDGPRQPLLDFSLLRDAKFIALLLSSTVAMIGFLPRYFLIPDSAVAQGLEATYASWLLGLMNGTSIIGRIGVGFYADRFGKINALTMSFVLCGLGHLMFWLPGVSVPSRNEGAVTALFTLFVVYTGIMGSGFLSLFPVVMSHLFGGEALASKQGLLNSIVGIGALVGPSAVFAIVGSGHNQKWGVGVIVSGSFMIAGGLLLGVSLSRLFRFINRVGESN